MFQFVIISRRGFLSADDNQIDRQFGQFRQKRLKYCTHDSLHSISDDRVAYLFANGKTNSYPSLSIVAIIQYQSGRSK